MTLLLSLQVSGRSRGEKKTEKAISLFKLGGTTELQFQMLLWKKKGYNGAKTRAWVPILGTVQACSKSNYSTQALSLPIHLLPQETGNLKIVNCHETQ